MFPRQVFGLAGTFLLVGLPRRQGPVSLRLSSLLTAAGQLRILTGFPFHSRLGETEEWG